MAAQTDSPTTPASAEKSVGSTLGSVSPPSDKSDHAEDSIVDVNLGTEGAKKENQDTESSSAVSSVAENQDPASASDIDKKIRRAERFGITVQLSEQEKRNSRAERFGTSTPHGSDSSKKAEELKRKTRAERFGITAPLVAKEEEAKKKARLERFGQAPKTDAVEDDKRKARALRFSQPPSASPAVNGKGSVEAKAAIAGKAGGGS